MATSGVLTSGPESNHELVSSLVEEKVSGGLISRSELKWLVFAGLHIPLALLMRYDRSVATAHAVLTLAVALALVLVKRRRDPAAAVAAGYIVGAEVLWRAARAGVFWEFGKYAVVAVLGFAVLRRRTVPRSALGPLWYFALLLPSIVLLASLDLERIRQEVSFNLSGPLCLAVCALYFSGLEADWRLLKRILMAVAAPIVGLATLALYSLMAAGRIQFTTESNPAAAGGFGPNQVSQILGLGVLCCWLLAIGFERRRLMRLAFTVLFVWFLSHALLTFSRGGVYLAGLGISVTLPYFLRLRLVRRRTVCALAVLVPLAVLFLIPKLDAFTGGFLSKRYSDTSGTNREKIASAHVKAWLEHPLFGVGPGMAKLEVADELGHSAASHTEFTRLLAEHGLFGLTALAILLASGLRRYRSAGTPLTKAFVSACLAWSFGAMAGYAMRVAATSFVMGLGWCSLQTDEERYR